MSQSYELIRGRCVAALEAVRDRIPEKTFKDVDGFIWAGEWGIGIEVLVSHLVELDIKITPAQFELLKSVMQEMEIEDRRDLGYLAKHEIS